MCVKGRNVMLKVSWCGFGFKGELAWRDPHDQHASLAVTSERTAVIFIGWESEGLMVGNCVYIFSQPI